MMNEEIEEIIRSHGDVLIVLLTDPQLEACRQTEAVVGEAQEWREGIRVLQLDISLHREWAKTYRVHGSPCTLVFKAGKLCSKARGRIGRAQLRECLAKAGLL